MPYNPETEQFFQAPATIVDSTPDGDTVQEGFDDRLTPAMEGVYTDLNLLKENGMIGVGIPATTTSRGIGRVATLADMEPDAAVENGPAFLAAGSEAVTTTPTAHAVPQADADGTLNNWFVVHPSMTGSCTTNGTTDNTLVLTGIVPALSLEVGDVIQITGSTGGLNDKLFTVESITDDNSIIVNYEHAGNRGNGSLKLEDETATVTITRIAKWYNAPGGLGQAWVDVSGSRVGGVDYTNLSPRDMSHSILFAFGNNYTFTYKLGGILSSLIVHAEGAGATSISNPVPSGSSYGATYTGEASVMSWMELR